MIIELRWQPYETAKVRDTDGQIHHIPKATVLEYRTHSGNYGDWSRWMPVRTADEIPAREWYDGQHRTLLNN